MLKVNEVPLHVKVRIWWAVSAHKIIGPMFYEAKASCEMWPRDLKI